MEGREGNTNHVGKWDASPGRQGVLVRYLLHSYGLVVSAKSTVLLPGWILAIRQHFISPVCQNGSLVGISLPAIVASAARQAG